MTAAVAGSRDVLPGEDDVVGGEGLAVVPGRRPSSASRSPTCRPSRAPPFCGPGSPRPGPARGCRRGPRRPAARRRCASRPGPWCRRRSAGSAGSAPATTASSASPPPPRLVGLYAGLRLGLATPDRGEHLRGQRRRQAQRRPWSGRSRDGDIAPAFTWSISPLSSRSSIDVLHPRRRRRSVTRLDAPAHRHGACHWQ